MQRGNDFETRITMCQKVQENKTYASLPTFIKPCIGEGCFACFRVLAL